MLALNHYLFLLINAEPGESHVLIALGRVVAGDVIGLVPLLLVLLWIRGRPDRRAGLVATAIAAALALGANQIVGQFWYEPRPFMIGLGRTLMAHAPENSFPSDHTTFMLTVGIALIATGAAPRWGRIVTLAGVLVAWARIYLGLHFPLDMLASAIIAGIFATLSVWLVPPARRFVVPWANRFYDRALDLMRLSDRLFPRASGER
ncbi:MAG: undecaprenyl-diphosphatase [Pseudolabrys sp.]